MRPYFWIFLAFGLLYTGGGLVPGRTLLPLDIADDLGAWKADPATRIPVSNSLLSDPIVQFVPWDAEILRLLSRREMPFVNAFAGEGGPLWANPQTAMLSPLTWPRWIFGFKGWAISSLLKLLAAALGAFWLAREMGATRREAAFSGLVYAGSGFLVVWLLFPHSQVAAFLPSLAAAALRLTRRPWRRDAGLVLLFAALCTAGGHPETLFVGVLGIAAWLLLETRAGAEHPGRALLLPALWAALGFLLLAVQIVPFLYLLADNAAAATRGETVHPFRPWSIVSQVFPGALGSPLRGELDLTAVAAAGHFNGRAGGFVGALALLAILLAWRELHPTFRRGLLVGGAALILSWRPPLLAPLLSELPVFGMLAFEYLVVPFVLFAAAAAGPALAILAARPRRLWAFLLLALGFGALAAGALPALPAARPLLTGIAERGIADLRERGHLQHPPEIYRQRLVSYLDAAGTTALRRVALPGACLALAGLALLLPGLPPRRRELLVAGAAIAELAAFGWGYNPAVARTALPPEPPAIAAIRERDPEGRFALAAQLADFPANLATLYGRRDAASYDVLTRRRRGELLRAAGYDPALQSLRADPSAAEVAALGGLGVRFVLSRGEVPGAERLPGAPPPALGVHEIAAAVPSPPPRNAPPAGFAAGLAVSVLAAAGAAAALLWRRPGIRDEGVSGL